MRTYLAAAFLSALLTFVAVLALYAPDPLVAVVAVAAVTALAAGLSSARSTDESAGLRLSNPAWTLTLTLRRRGPLVELLPLWASQVVGSLVAALAAMSLDSAMPEPLVWPSADPLATAALALVLGLAGAWAVAAADSYLGDAVTALPVLAAGAVLPVNLAGVLSPAVVFGITVAGLLDWQIAAIAAVGVLVGAAVGGWTASLFALDRA